jgi:hypothetical protein
MLPRLLQMDLAGDLPEPGTGAAGIKLGERAKRVCVRAGAGSAANLAIAALRWVLEQCDNPVAAVMIKVLDSPEGVGCIKSFFQKAAQDGLSEAVGELLTLQGLVSALLPFVLGALLPGAGPVVMSLTKAFVTPVILFMIERLVPEKYHKITNLIPTGLWDGIRATVRSVLVDTLVVAAPAMLPMYCTAVRTILPVLHCTAERAAPLIVPALHLAVEAAAPVLPKWYMIGEVAAQAVVCSPQVRCVALLWSWLRQK